MLVAIHGVSTALDRCSGMDHSPDIECIKQFFKLQESLLNDTATKFTLAQLFYPGPDISPSLLHITYNITLTGSESGRCQPDSDVLNHSQLHSFDFGWSDRSLYHFFHPAIINQLRYQLPFWIMNMSNAMISEDPTSNVYTWEGLYPLSSVTLNLTVPACECLNKTTLRASLYELTEYVSYS